MLDREDVKKVAHLARLELTDAETDAFTGQLAQILDYVEQLNELDTDNIAPTAHAIDMRNVTRPDTLETYEHREDVLNSAPAREGDFFRVPKIM
jgi:aspartyl-tRNA(Asn)/glutamyl-tRNA(Gln) amidotransferase subunit C